MRRFRFGLQLIPDQPTTVASRAAHAEALGFDTVLIPDHIGRDWSPLLSLGAAGQATERIRLGTFVLNCCLHHPVMLAREIATLDQLSGGRVELGLGAGHTPAEFAATGTPLDAVTRRKQRLASYTRILRSLLDGETVNWRDEFYDLADAAILPPLQEHLPILVGGGGRPLLTHASQHADIVGLTGAGKPLADGYRLTVKWEPWRLDEQVTVIGDAAGDRDIEINALVQRVSITNDRERDARELADEVEGLSVDDALATPFLALGTVDEIVAQLQAARERWGITYFVVRDAEAFAPVIAALK